MSTGPAGYSGTPLAQKLGLKPGHRFVLVNAPRHAVVPDQPIGVEEVRVDGWDALDAPADVVLVFVRAAADLDAAVDLGRSVFPDGSVWVAWPRRAGGHDSDVSERDIRAAALPLGLVDVKVAALDTDWSGLKLVWRKELRGGEAPPAAGT